MLHAPCQLASYDQLALVTAYQRICPAPQPRKLFRQCSQTNSDGLVPSSHAYRGDYVSHKKVNNMSVSKAWLESAIHTLEVRLLERKTRLDRDILNSLLAPDFVEFGANGVVWNRAQIIDALLEQDFVQRQIYDFQIRILSETVVLTTYRCAVLDPSGGSESLRSSIWRQVGGDWQMAFHQGTARVRE